MCLLLSEFKKSKLQTHLLFTLAQVTRQIIYLYSNSEFFRKQLLYPSILQYEN